MGSGRDNTGYGIETKYDYMSIYEEKGPDSRSYCSCLSNFDHRRASKRIEQYMDVAVWRTTP
jgi:hypothetical protein